MPAVARQRLHLWSFAGLVLLATQSHLPAADEVRSPPYLTTDAQREAWPIGWPQWHGSPTHRHRHAGRDFTVADADPASLPILDHACIKEDDGKRRTQDAAPAYACGLMYIRTNNSLRCYDLRAK